MFCPYSKNGTASTDDTEDTGDGAIYFLFPLGLFIGLPLLLLLLVLLYCAVHSLMVRLLFWHVQRERRANGLAPLPSRSDWEKEVQKEYDERRARGQGILKASSAAMASSAAGTGTAAGPTMETTLSGSTV
ncbi:hypothetical protein VTL71DRAFT_13585 [Oculimacula yallundae]|uniref:Uncharacterized protein n=1 Tax=Oculimacula yallundae TaxID=86028 RepID=A0ABR4CLB4_9HELO